MSVEEARALVSSGDADAVKRIDGEFALVGRRRSDAVFRGGEGDSRNRLWET